MNDALVLDTEDIIDLLAYNYSVEKEKVKYDGEHFIVILPGERKIWEGENNVVGQVPDK